LNKSYLIYIFKIIVALSKIAVLSFSTRYISTELWGLFQKILLIFLICIPIIESGLSSSFYYFFVNEKKTKIVFGSHSLLLLIYSFCLILISSVYFVLFDISFIHFPFLILYILSSTLVILFDCYFYALKKTKYIVISTLFIGILYSLSIFLFSYLSLSINTLFVLLSLPSLIIFLIYAYILKQKFRINLFYYKETKLLDFFNYGFPVSIASLVGVLNRKIDILFVSYTLSLSTIAIYSFGSYEIPLIAIVTNVLFSQSSPKLHELSKNNKEVVNLWKTLQRVSYIFICPLFITVFYFSNPLFLAVFSSKYQESIPIFQVFLLLIPLRTTNFGILLRIINKTKFITISSFISLGFNLTFIYLFYSYFGLIGLSISVVASIYILAFFQLYFYVNQTKISFKNFFDYKFLLLMTITLVLTNIIFDYVFEKTNINNIFIKVSFTMIFGFVILLTNKTLRTDFKNYYLNYE